MKKIFTIAILCTALFSSCDDLIYINGNPGPPPVASCLPSFVHVPAEGDSAINIQIIINSPVEGAKISARETCEWFTVKEVNNERAIVAVAPNPSDSARYGDITFLYNNKEFGNLGTAQEGRE